MRRHAPAAPLLAALLLLVACGGGDADTAADGDAVAAASSDAAAADNACEALTSVPSDSMTATDSGLRYLQLADGQGRTAGAGDTVAVHYTGCLTDGTKFDSSRDRGQPIRFVLGTGRVIEGWDEGLEGMQVGGERILRIPPELAYGSSGNEDIPPSATLLFRVELMEVAAGG